MPKGKYNNPELDHRKFKCQSKRYTPGKSAYKRFFTNNHYREKGLDFEVFMNLCQQDCIYCGAPPKRTNPYGNVYTPSSFHGMSEQFWNDSWIYLNGIDKMDATQKDYKDNFNLVPCCKQCNFMKCSLSFSEFINKINTISNRFEDYNETE